MTLPFSGKEAFLFDFDGTLAHLTIDFKSLREKILDLAAMFGLQNPSLPDPSYLLEMSRSLQEQIGRQNEEAAESFFAGAMNLIEQAEREAAIPENLFPETLPLLNRLKARSIKRAILTRNSGASVYRVFPDLDRYVEIFLPREKVSNPKPDRQHLLTALSSLKISPEKTVMVGDHPLDILAGRQAGTATIGVLTGKSGEKELKDAGADLVLSHIRDLLDLV
jgi:phosphoglycolate phosphatase